MSEENSTTGGQSAREDPTSVPARAGQGPSIDERIQSLEAMMRTFLTERGADGQTTFRTAPILPVNPVRSLVYEGPNMGLKQLITVEPIVIPTASLLAQDPDLQLFKLFILPDQFLTADCVVPTGYRDIYCGDSTEANAEYMTLCMMLTVMAGAYQRRLQRDEPGMDRYKRCLLDFIEENEHIIWPRLDRFRVRKMEGYEASNYLARGSVGSVASAITPASRSRLMQYHSEMLKARTNALVNRGNKPKENKPAAQSGAAAAGQQ